MPITVYSRQARANKVAEEWRKSYQNEHGNWYGSQNAGTIYEQLLALGPTPDPDAVNATIGNCAWVDSHCDNCGIIHGWGVIEIGQEPDHESATALICPECLLEAYRLAQEHGFHAG